MKRNKSKKEFINAKKLMPGGVNSPVRSFKSVFSFPSFIDRGKDQFIFDIDGNKYLDFCLSWGSLILGHAYKDVITEVSSVLRKGTSFGTPNKYETKLASSIIRAIPSIEMIRFVNSGTEAAISAIRLAKKHTKRNKIIKFDGGYHGHLDYTQKDTISLPFNDFEAVSAAFYENKNEIAAVIVEPILGNIGVVLPKGNFLKFLRGTTKKNGSLLICDEVITGFRFNYGGIQEYFQIEPDLTLLGKVIGGGLPVGAYGGRKDIMSLISPSGDVFQAGTFSGNPISMSAGITTLETLKVMSYKHLNDLSTYFINGLKTALAGKSFSINNFGSMFTVFCTKDNIIDFVSAKKSDLKHFARFYFSLFKKGIYFVPSQFESNFISFAHTKSNLKAVIKEVETCAHIL